MGRAKEYAFEQTENGFSYAGDERVCADCMKVEYLLNFVSDFGVVGRCDFCEGDGVVIDLHDLFIEMSECIRSEFLPAYMSDDIPEREWEIDVPSISSQELLWEFDNPLGEGKLAERFVDAFSDDWIRIGVLAGTPDEHLGWSWDSFVDTVKTTSRFVFLHPSSQAEEGDDYGPAEMLDRLAAAIERCGAVILYPAGQSVFRGRKHAPTVVLETEESLGAPPAYMVGSQRMNPPGISYFYGTTDEETTLAELRGLDGDGATVAKWVTSRDCHIVDLARLHEIPSIFDRERTALRIEVRFLKRFAREISKPMRAHDNPNVDYVPTQIVAEYIRHVMRDQFGGRIEGLMYPSVAMPGRTNIVFFPSASNQREFVPSLIGPIVRYEALGVSTDWKRMDSDDASSDNQ